MAGGQAPVVATGGVVVEIGVGGAQAVAQAQAPVELAFRAGEADAIAIVRTEVDDAERIADQSGDFLVEQAYIHGQPGLAEKTVVADLARTGVFLAQVAGAVGAGEVVGFALPVGRRCQVADPVAPVDVVFVHARRPHRLRIDRAQTVLGVEQVVHRQPRAERAAGALDVFEHPAALQQPVFAGMPLQLAEQPPDLAADPAAVEGLGVCLVVAVAQAVQQAQVVAQAEGVLHLQVVAAFPDVAVDPSADRAQSAVA